MPKPKTRKPDRRTEFNSPVTYPRPWPTHASQVPVSREFSITGPINESATSRSYGICGAILGLLKRCTIDHTAMEAALCFGFSQKRMERSQETAGR